MSYPELRLSNQLCFLFYRANREIESRYRPLLAELGLTYPQYLTLMVLWERGEVTVSELCAALSLDTGTVSPILKRMERDGIISKRRNEKDERSVRISLTAKGQSLEKKARAIPAQIAHCVLKEDSEYLDLKGRLTGIIDRLGKT
jgi:MarR family transcriptional regulator, organic hydroperoxide resistance regulator